MKHSILLVASVLTMVMCLANALKAQDRPERPNIVIIYADDVGYGDIGAYGAEKIPTPNIDRLTGEGNVESQKEGGARERYRPNQS